MNNSSVYLRARHTVESVCRGIWYGSHASTAPETLLRPLLYLGSRLYSLGLNRNQRKIASNKHLLPATVISVGNIVAGGTGKTPIVLWLIRYLIDRGFSPAILSRGYGRRGDRIARVPVGEETRGLSLRFGDEPVLMALKSHPVPVWVGRERWTSGQSAIRESNADVLVMDDGYQHLSLERNLDLVLIDACEPFGNGSLLPLGPLREPPQNLDRADAVILTRADNASKANATHAAIKRSFPHIPVFACRHRLGGLRRGIDGKVLRVSALNGQRSVAFAGIARPEAFFSALVEQGGARLCTGVALPDHHVYCRQDLVNLLRVVRETQASFLVTTEKDFVRLPAWFQAFTLAAELEIGFVSEFGSFISFLDERLSSRSRC